MITISLLTAAFLVIGLIYFSAVYLQSRPRIKTVINMPLDQQDEDFVKLAMEIEAVETEFDLMKVTNLKNAYGFKYRTETGMEDVAELEQRIERKKQIVIWNSDKLLQEACEFLPGANGYSTTR